LGVTVGVNIIMRAIEEPLRWIATRPRGGDRRTAREGHDRQRGLQRAANAVFFIRKGKIKLTVASKSGKEAVIGALFMAYLLAWNSRSRVSFFMNKFRKLGFIACNDELEVHNSLLNVILRD
jgi:hypothetical protein